MAIRRFSKALLSYQKDYGVVSGRVYGNASGSGGTYTTSGGYGIHTFTTTGSSTFTIGIGVVLEYLIVGAGGSCAVNQGGNRESGSGAGGLLSGSLSTSTNSYPLFVGNGISGKNNGENSTGFSLTCYGGGAGANYDFQAGNSGGSGGGGWYGGAGGAGVAGQGNAGGSPGSSYSGGGGGGAGAAGSFPTGGAGLSNSITGSAYTYSRGGYANTFQSTVYNTNGANYGDGANAVGTGAKGIIVIRYTIVQSVLGYD